MREFLADPAEAFDQRIRGISAVPEREPATEGRVELPPGTVLVSADNHWSVTDDVFYENFPAHLKDRAPRILPDGVGGFDWYVKGQPLLPTMQREEVRQIDRCLGSTFMEPRMFDLDLEGIQQEIVFGNTIAAFYGYPDLEVREWVFRTYNQHLVAKAQEAPGRFYGVGLVNYWDMDKVFDSIAELADQGLKTYILPQNPKGPDGVLLNYCDPEMDPLWSAVEEVGLPVCFHVGETSKPGPGGLGITVMVNLGPFRKTLGELIFGGIFDKHPKLQVVFVEAEVNWVPGALQTAATLYECFPNLNPQIKHHPRHYWHNHCYTAFTHDPAGMRLIDIVGTDRIMWSADYPHQEATFGFSDSVIREVLAVTTPDEARMILGGTARQVFNLD